jgi:hypothetical protein
LPVGKSELDSEQDENGEVSFSGPMEGMLLALYLYFTPASDVISK